MEETPLQFIDTWNLVAMVLGMVLASSAILLMLSYLGKLLFTIDLKARYDHIGRRENSSLWTTIVLLTLASASFGNAFIEEIGPVWLIIRLFVTIIAATLLLISARHFLRFYYPFYIEKRLKRLRYKPRISAKSGKPMKLLSEAEEDVYLDEGMQAEENIFSVDYDVWLDEETGFTKIEKYAGHLHASQCPDCNYLTYKVVKEEILQRPSASEVGKLAKYYKCGYCGYKGTMEFSIAVTKEEDLDPAPPTASQ